MTTQKSVSLTFTKENADRFLCLQDELRVDGNGLLELFFKLYDDNKAKLNTLTNCSSSSGGVTSGSGGVTSGSSGGGVSRGTGGVTSSSSGGGSVNTSTSYSSGVVNNVDSNCSSSSSISDGGDSGGCVLGLVNSAYVENIHIENLDENLNKEPCEDSIILDQRQQVVGEPDLNERPYEDPVKLDKGQDLAETGLCYSESLTDTQPQRPLDTATTTITPTIVAATTTTSNSRTTTVSTTAINTTTTATTTSSTDNTKTTAANTTTSTTAAAITTTTTNVAAATSLNSRTTTVNTTITSTTTTTTTTTTAATTTAGTTTAAGTTTTTTTAATTATATNSPDNTITTVAAATTTATTTCASTGLALDRSQRVVDRESGETAELLISLKNIQNRDHSSSSSSSRRSQRRRSISTVGDNSRNYREGGDGRMIVKEEKLTESVVGEDPADGFDAPFAEPLHKVIVKERLSTESEVVAFSGRISSLEHTSEGSHMEVLASPIQVSSSDVVVIVGDSLPTKSNAVKNVLHVSNHCGQTSEEEKHIHEEEEEEEFSVTESVKYKREEKEDRFPRQVSSSDVVDVVSDSSSFMLLPLLSNAAKSMVQVSDSCVQTSEEEADNDKHMYDHEEKGEFLVESVRCKEESEEKGEGEEREGVVTAADDDCDDDVVIDETELKLPESVEPKLKRRNRVWLSRIQDADFEERHYKCSYCAAAFFHPHHLQRHVKQLHKSGKTAKPNQCRDCFKSFATLLTLKFHQDFACRMVRRPHRCTLCQLGFKSTEQVQKHKCSTNPSKPLCCPQFQCDYRTGSPRDLEHHLRIHTGERCYKCELCDFRTAWKKNLKEHVLKHSGLKPFVCHVCNFASNDKSNLRSHLTKHSAEENHPKKMMTKKKNNNNSSSSSRCCHVCRCSFLDVRLFMQHMRTHSDDELHPFCMCPICPYLTRYKSSLKSHMRTHQSIGQQQQKITEEKVIEFGTSASNGASAGIFTRAENCASIGNRGSAVIFASAANADVSSSNVGNTSSSCNASVATDAAGSITSSSRSSRDVGNECEPMREVYVEATAMIDENYSEQQKQYYMCEECSFMVDDRNAFDSHLCYSSSQAAAALTQSTASFLDNGGMVIQIIEDPSQLTE